MTEEPEKSISGDDEFEAMPKRRRGCTIIAGILVILVLLLGTIPAVLYFSYRSAGGDDPGMEPVAFRIDEGQGVSEIADNLEAAGVVRSASRFRLYLKVKRLNPTIQAGDYELRTDMGGDAVLAAFAKGPIRRYRPLTLPPGLTVQEQADKVRDQLAMDREFFIEELESQARASLFPDAGNAEGLCFPETYHIQENTNEGGVASECLAQFKKVFDALDQSRLASLGISPYEAVIVASLVEREAKVAEERPIIASVIYNRLRKKMPLQIDATVLYALGRHKEKILYDDLKVDSPYNTYKVSGLPPTPIAAPSKSALEAAMNPASTNYIYYVLTDSSGKHAFTDNAKEFERLKADAIRRGVY